MHNNNDLIHGNVYLAHNALCLLTRNNHGYHEYKHNWKCISKMQLCLCKMTVFNKIQYIVW